MTETRMIFDALGRVFGFLGSLSSEQIAGLAEGSARLEYVTEEPAGSVTVTDRPTSKPSRRRTMPGSKDARNSIIDRLTASELRQRLGELSSREEATQFLIAGRPTKVRLIDVARSLDIRASSADRKDEIVDRIVEGTLGYRLRHEALRGESR